MSAAPRMPASLERAGEHQPAARAALAAALAAGPSHAYALLGPAGSGKRALARAFAAELLASAASDPERARRLALAEPSPHPDLTWIAPPGNQHLVEEIRSRLIGPIAYRPFDGGRSVFVIEAADAMAEESQNALLKTLEEPPSYAHIVLISSEPPALLETVLSRCQKVPFSPLPRELVERRLSERFDLPPETLAALAALSGGDLDQAAFLASERGSRLREIAIGCCRAARAGRLQQRPWSELLELAGQIGKERGAAVDAEAGARAEELGKGRQADRVRRAGAEAAKRAERRARTAAIDVALALCAAWFADLVAHAEGVGGLARNLDRGAELEADSSGLDPALARRAAERAIAARRRLTVNVSEELALEALFHDAAAWMTDPASRTHG
jgi:DNA polymerase-3 subunit delta'